MRVGISIIFILISFSCNEITKSSVSKDNGFINYIDPTTDTVDITNNKYTFKWNKAAKNVKAGQLITYEFRSSLYSHPDSMIKNRIILKDTNYTKEFIFNNVLFYWQVVEVNNHTNLKIYGKVDSIFLSVKSSIK